ncbi:ABC transporter substrate-binding protein [Paractinoplanes toevensis]|uniref:Nitrate ABC transporter substrate-binding protein n=1 Tax=Paractinoplanes toevensis TaxID=571911 RepID=A0A919W482_9ACTN|nr:ABC transporter substrate-binding protein [Actinoplanes toevensis]GIM89808.1 nitrate ABC transporter substrate-binding protein [Actinoplanes toevensis]
MKRIALITSALLLGATLSACGDSASAADDDAAGQVTLTFGFQTADYPALLEASGLFKDLPYKLETPVIAGPAAQISALYSKATDVGLVGENTAAFEAANAADDWSKSKPKVYTIAGVTAKDAPYPAPSLFVRKSANINSLAELRGKSIAYNFGGNIYAGYVKVLANAGLTVKDIKPVQLPDNQAAAASFVAGQVDAVVTGYANVKRVVDSGEAVRLATNADLGVIGGAGFISRPDVLEDEARLAAVKDFFSRFSKFYSEWYPNNEAAVEKVYQTVLKQTPELSKINWENGAKSRLYKIGDPAFQKTQQEIVDAAFKAGGVKNERDISSVFNPVIDASAVPQ